MLRQAEELVAAGIPVMGHLGLTPQSVNAFGGYRVQGRGEDGERLLQDAKALEAAGAFAVVLECVPAELAARVTGALSIPTIGIGAGPGLRRAGAGLAGHGRAVPADPEVRQALRGRGRRARPGRAVLRRRGGRRPVPRARSTPTADLARTLRPRLALGRRGLGAWRERPIRAHISLSGDLDFGRQLGARNSPAGLRGIPRRITDEANTGPGLGIGVRRGPGPGRHRLLQRGRKPVHPGGAGHVRRGQQAGRRGHVAAGRAEVGRRPGRWPAAGGPGGMGHGGPGGPPRCTARRRPRAAQAGRAELGPAGLGQSRVGDPGLSGLAGRKRAATRRSCR